MKIKYPIDIVKLNSRSDYYNDIQEAYQEAVQYITGFKWCKVVKSVHLYYSLGDKLNIFLFDIDNTSSFDDNLIWIIVGDLPSMYLDTNGPRTTVEVIEDYVMLAENWISQVKAGGSLKDCYPFNAQPTFEMADLLEKRSNFMKDTLIPNMENIPLQIQPTNI
jgi:hypothetical protein